MIRSGFALSGELQIAYEDWGDIRDPAILLIMGVGGQMLLWPDDFCRELTLQGFRVIRFDNRDVGLSSRTAQQSAVPRWKLMLRAQLGWTSPVPYTLHDMANDAVAVLDHLDLRSAYVLGASMGGMIAQLLAASHSERVRRLIILFSSTNQPLLPLPASATLKALTAQPRPNATNSELALHQRHILRTIGSPVYPMNDRELDQLVARLVSRGIDIQAADRQMSALLGTGNLLPYTRKITTPTLVLHGQMDRLIRPACGRAVARAIPGAKFELIDGMAHDLPRPLWPRILSSITEHCAQQGSSRRQLVE